MKKTNSFTPINLTEDIVFQYFFTRYQGALISLLQALLPLPQNHKITSLKILNPKLHPLNNPEEKHSICDLKLTLNTGEKVNVEMQNFPEKHFFKRTLFYLSRLYTEGLKKGGGYNQLPDTYLLILTNFTLFQQTGDYYSSFSFRRDEKPHFMFHRALRVVTVELNKFPRKRISALFDLKEQWCYMLKRSDRMREEELNHLGERSKDMKEVTDHFKELSASEQRRFLEEHRQKSEWVFHNQKEYARDEGRAEGLKQGREEGMVQGREEGREEGRVQGREEGRVQGMKQATEQNMKQVALQMLKENIGIHVISRVTGITKKKVLKLKAEVD